MSYAYYIPYASCETTAEDVERVFDTEMGKGFVASIETTITQDYKGSWNAFTVRFNDECVDKLVTSVEFVNVYGITDESYELYYTTTDFWKVYLIKV
jgi:hypothetical protein